MSTYQFCSQKGKNGWLLLSLMFFTLSACVHERPKTADPIAEDSHEYVDLGLPSGLKWATCNVGASSQYDPGDYFAWGETTTKSEYSVENSKTYGVKYRGDISGYPDLDAACANWGDKWRLPTRKEAEELIENCRWIWIRSIGGWRGRGPNGNSIFLPVTGYCDATLGGRVSGLPGSRGIIWYIVGRYWTATPTQADASKGHAWSIRFIATPELYPMDVDLYPMDVDRNDYGPILNGVGERNEGYAVRPVLD